MLTRLKFDISVLVQEILDGLPPEVFSSTTTTFLDPAIGGGQFVAEIERRLRDHGHSDANIHSRVFGFERGPVAIRYAVNKHNLVGNYTCKTSLEFLELDTDMQFDVVVGNPPYNSTDTSRQGIAHRGQGDNLAKKFTVKSLELSRKFVVMILPYGERTYSESLADRFRIAGLHTIIPCKSYFPEVSTNPCVFYFDKTTVVDQVRDAYNTHNYVVSPNNIGNIFKNQPGKLNRVDYEHLLKDTGKYRVIVTTAIVKYTDDPTIVERMADKTRGKWRVVFNCTTQLKKIGRLIIADPTCVLSKSVHCLLADSQQHAEQLKTYMESSTVQEILSAVKIINACNSKKFLQYIPLP